MRRHLERVGLAAALAGAALLGGCQQDYLARRDTVTFQAGDAVAANKVVHIIDPWPASAATTRLETSGVRAAAAIERYQTRPPGTLAETGAGGASQAGATPTMK
jgi:hypothetical protein